jgi:hypothetical protein
MGFEMNIRTFALGLVAAIAALPVMADNIDGKWIANVESPQGPMEVTMEFKAEGEKLAGTLSVAGMENLPISEGVVKGADVTFKLSLDLGGNQLTIDYVGKVAGDKLDLVSKMDAGPGGVIESQVAATRVKPAVPAK